MTYETAFRREDADAMVVPIRDDHVAVHVGADTPGEGQLAFTGALRAELGEGAAGAGEDLHAVVIRVGHDDLVVQTDCHV